MKRTSMAGKRKARRLLKKIFKYDKKLYEALTEYGVRKDYQMTFEFLTIFSRDEQLHRLIKENETVYNKTNKLI